MRSLKGRLILWTTMGAAGILLAAGCGLYFLVRASLVQQCDDLLLDKARLLAAIAEQSSGKLRLELDEFQLSQFGTPEHPSYLQVWLADGTTIFRYPALQQASLEAVAGPLESPVYRWVDLPDGQTGRAVGITFSPRDKDAAEDALHQQEEPAEPGGEASPRHLPAEGAELLISEFMAANDGTLVDQDGEFSDWIEIYNSSDHTVDLEGWSLTDRVGTLQWRFPEVTLEAGEYLLVFASGKDRREPLWQLHANFRLDADGEYLALVRPDGRTIESAYVPQYPRHVVDASYGLSADLERAGYFRRPTPGAANDNDQTDQRPVPISGQITLVLARDTQSINATLARLGVLLCVVGAVAVPMLIGALWLAVRRSLRSLDHLAGQISRLREHDLSERIDVPRSPQELKPVIDRLNRLLRQLDAALQRERGFSADVAHELRTPLAGLLLKMDLALSQVRQPDEYRELVADCREITTQMQGMVENLLSLARLEAGRVKLKHEPVLLDELIRDSWKPFHEPAQRRRVQVSWSLRPDARVKTDRTQIGVAVRNLLENAVTYVNEGGHVKIALGVEDGQVSFRVRNSGSHLAEEDAGHVFERFWRGSTARSEAGTHCGLGLSLTRRIVELLGGSVTVQSSKGGDYEVAVTLAKDQDGPQETS